MSENQDWPDVEGRYKIGDPKSCVAVCTMASLDLIEKIPNGSIALIGKCVTENLGIEKIVKNMISNPNIRFIILCGKVSEGHFVGQAIKSLIANGVDSEKRIVGARGGMPVLKNLSDEEIEMFRKQMEAIDLIGETNTETIMKSVEDCFRRNIGSFNGGVISMEEKKEINAWYDERNEYVPDTKGFFTIHVDKEGEKIIVEYYSNDKVLQNKIVGKNAEDIYQTIKRLGIVSRLEHAAYLGSELAKAEIALKNNLDYEQEKDLSLTREFSNITETTDIKREGVRIKTNDMDSKNFTYICSGGRMFMVKELTKKEPEFVNLLKNRGICRIFNY